MLDQRVHNGSEVAAEVLCRLGGVYIEHSMKLPEGDQGVHILIYIIVNIQNRIALCEIIVHPYTVVIPIVIVLPFALKASDADLKGNLLRLKFMKDRVEIFLRVMAILA